MINAVLDQITAALNAAGIHAVRQFPAEPLAAETVVCVGGRSCSLTGAGGGEYLGMRQDADGNCYEIYGCRLELEAALDIYAEVEGPGGEVLCMRCFEAVSDVLAGLSMGLKKQKLTCGEVAYDRAVEMSRCQATLTCTAYLTRDLEEDTGVFTDFVLRGVLKNG